MLNNEKQEIKEEYLCEYTEERFDTLNDDDADEVLNIICYGAYNHPFYTYVSKNLNVFAKLLFRHFDIVNNPKKDMLFGKCWSAGHSSGYAEVMNVMAEWVDLIK